MSRSASSPSLVRRISPVVSASRRPTGYSRRSLSTSLTTVGRPWVSCAVDTTPAGLFSRYTSRGSGAAGRPSTSTPLSSSTSRAGSVTGSPPTLTLPSAISPSAARRDATPAWARYFASRMASKRRLAGVDLELLDSILAARGEPRFRARQVWEWVARGASSYAEMSNLPTELRSALTAEVPLSSLSFEDEALASDGTQKALLRTHDGRPLEAVLMRYRDGRRSLCLSSQSGCPLTCTFCATGRMKFGRNLTASEILDQALHFRRQARVNHAVFMGMGEPLLNLDNVLAACERLPDLGIATSNTAISTVGWVPGIERLAREGRPVRLALSLHAPEEALRSELMPVNERYPLHEVLAACRDWHAARKREVFIEYLMLDGVNDRVEQAHALADLLREPRNAFKVNLIPYNPTEAGFEGSTRAAIDAFRSTLESRGLRATVRLTRGRDIDAACGQLAVKAAA